MFASSKLQFLPDLLAAESSVNKRHAIVSLIIFAVVFSASPKKLLFSRYSRIMYEWLDGVFEDAMGVYDSGRYDCCNQVHVFEAMGAVKRVHFADGNSYERG